MNKITDNDLKLLKKKYVDMSKIINKIKEGYPVQYLIGHVDFYGNKIKVNSSVLIPRFETETLVEKTVNYIKKNKLENSSVLELGTGSGCISITLKKELPHLQITAVDISKKAIKVAKFNTRKNKTKISFICKDIFKLNLLNNYDILVSNPPYIKKDTKIDPKTKYEPQIALYSDCTGINYYIEIFKIAKLNLNKKSLIALEIDEDEGEKIRKLAKTNFPKGNITIEKDLVGKDRYLFIQNNK